MWKNLVAVSLPRPDAKQLPPNDAGSNGRIELYELLRSSMILPHSLRLPISQQERRISLAGSSLPKGLIQFNAFSYSYYCPPFSIFSPFHQFTRHLENGENTSSSLRLINLLLRPPTCRRKILALRDPCSSSLQHRFFQHASRITHTNVRNDTFSSSCQNVTCSYLRYQRSL
jgi:hypothetical protein